MKLDHIFPIPVYTTTLSDESFNDIKNKVETYIQKTEIPDLPMGELKTTFYDNQNFLGSLNADLVSKEISQRTREFFNLLGYDPKCFIEITSWLQLYPPNSFFIKHDHFGAILSGVFYIKVPENSGNLRFYNPVSTRRVTNTFFQRLRKTNNEYNYHYVEYTPKEGEMIMFEPWLEHSVEFNRSSEDRIAISFNIWADEYEPISKN
jgi:uncharacterized protein (TIGR02466 family)